MLASHCPRQFDQSDYFPKFTNPEVRWLPGIKASFLLLLLRPLLCRHFLLLLTSPPETGERNIRETKVQNARAATLTSSLAPSPSAALNTGIAVGTEQGKDDSSAVTACHAFPGPLLVTENAGMMPPTRLARTLISAMAFLSCLTPESADPCVQVCVLSALFCFWIKLPSAQNFPQLALVSFICKKESNYLQDLSSQSEQMIHGY